MGLNRRSIFCNFVKLTWNQDLQPTALVTTFIGNFRIFKDQLNFTTANCSLSNLVQNTSKIRRFQNSATGMTQVFLKIYLLMKL